MSLTERFIMRHCRWVIPIQINQLVKHESPLR